MRASRSNAHAIIKRCRMEKCRYLGGNPGKTLVKYGNELLEVCRPTMRDSCGANGIFEHEVPAYDPREQFTQSGVSVRVSRPCNRHHGSKLSVAKRSKDTGDSGHHKREHERRAG